MSDLIVDFPQRSRRTSYERARRAVHFSSMNELRFVETHDTASDINTSWYCAEDYRAFKLANTEAVKDVRIKVLALTTSSRKKHDDDGNQLSPLEDCALTGIENLLTPKIIKKKIAYRRQCWSAVLEEQERQRLLGIYDVERIACASARCSKWSAKRSREIGLLQSS